MPTPIEISSGVSLASVREELQGLTGFIVSIGTIKKTDAGEHQEIARNLMIDTYGAINSARNSLGTLVVALGGVLPDLGGNGGGDDGGEDPGNGGGMPTEGAEPANPASVQRLENAIATATLNGDTQAWNQFDTSEYFPDLGNIFSTFFNEGDTLQIDLENVPAGNYDLYATFGGSPGGGIFDATLNGGAAATLDTIRGADTEVYGSLFLEAQEITEDAPILLLTCTQPGQLNLALITIKA